VNSLNRYKLGRDLGWDHATVRLIKPPYGPPSGNPDSANPTFRWIERQKIGCATKDKPPGVGDRGHAREGLFAGRDGNDAG
jgi:hypothetical protein